MTEYEEMGQEMHWAARKCFHCPHLGCSMGRVRPELLPEKEKKLVVPMSQMSGSALYNVQSFLRISTKNILIVDFAVTY